MSEVIGETSTSGSSEVGTDHNSESVRQPALWERHPTLTAGLISIVAALLAGAIGYLGAMAGANASLDVAKVQTQAENERRAQDRRDVAYKDVLNAANDYFYAWDAIQKTPSGSAINGATFDQFLTSRREYRGRMNDLFVHGSDAGWAAAQELHATVPALTSDSTLPSLDSDLDPTAFRAAFNKLLEIRCNEAAAVIRSTCAAE